MVGTSSSSSSSSSSSCASFGSFDDVSAAAAAAAKPSSPAAATETIKFLCSYGGRIVPRYPDGKLRYFGGDTRVLSVHRSLPFQELQAKMKEMCGWEQGVYLRCQLPTEDLDALVSVTSDEDLANLVEEYDLASRDRLLPLKIRAFLLPPPPPKPSTKTPSLPSTPPFSSAAAAAAAAAKSISPSLHSRAARAPFPPDLRYFHHPSSSAYSSAAAPPRFHHRHHHHRHHHRHGGAASPAAAAHGGNFLLHHGSHWQ